MQFQLELKGARIAKIKLASKKLALGSTTKNLQYLIGVTLGKFKIFCAFARASARTAAREKSNAKSNFLEIARLDPNLP